MLVSCDSFKVAKCKKETEIVNSGAEGSKLDFSFIVPVKTVNELSRMLDDDEDETVQIYMTRKSIIFMLGDLVFFSRLVDGRYIDYERVLLKTHKIHIKIGRGELLSALERAALITEERIAGSVRSHVKLHLDGDLLKIYATSTAGSTYDELPVVHEGDDLVIAFNNRYLIDSLRACTADTVRISMTSALTSINIEPVEESDDHSELFFLLPVRMKE